MKLLFSAASAFLAFAGLAAAAIQADHTDPNMELQLLDPEFASLFTNASFVRDPSYQKEMAELEKTLAALYGDNGRSNTVMNAGVSPHDSHGKHYCVGHAWNPSRVRVFENRLDCTIEGWTTVMSFCIPRQIVTTNTWHRVDGCVGIAYNPTRSMYFRNRKNCNVNGWTHDFQLPYQGMGRPPYNFLKLWEAFDPHRMNVSPGGTDLTSSGWSFGGDIQAFTISYPMTPNSLQVVKPHLEKAAAIYKRSHKGGNWFDLQITMFSIVYEALRHLARGFYHVSHGTHLQSFTDIETVREMAREFYPSRRIGVDLVRTQYIPNGGFEGHAVTLEVRADGILAASILLDEGINYGEGWIRDALVQSMSHRATSHLYRVFDVNNRRYEVYLKIGTLYFKRLGYMYP